MPSVFIKTYGCQMNERDSESVAAQLVAKGYVLAPTEAEADIILLNTCSVRDMAEKKALGKMVNLASQTRRKKSNKVLGFLGCMAQSRGGSVLESIPELKLVLGTQKIHRTAEYLDELLSGRQKQIVDVAEEEGSESLVSGHLTENPDGKNFTAFVSIMQGCNQHCTFCIVPHTRGSERSRTIDDIVAECRKIAGQGIREITLLGQIVTSFGRGDIPVKDGKSPFVQLLEAVHQVDGIERIRFTAPHPKGYGDDLVDVYGRLPKVVESAHIPVQSGSDRILKLMHRGYTRERFLEIVRKLRRVRPGIGICTDLIVGFPGETEEDFQETLSLCREVEFDMAYIFKYSPRRDTPAAAMPGMLTQEELDARNQRLLEQVNSIADRRYQECVGKTEQILMEGPSRRNPKRMMGRTPSNKIVLIDSDDSLLGKLVDVKITRAGSFTLYGERACPSIMPQ